MKTEEKVDVSVSVAAVAAASATSGLVPEDAWNLSSELSSELGSSSSTNCSSTGRVEFDWLVNYDSFRSLLRDWLMQNNLWGNTEKLSALVLGCGSSGLSQALVDDGVCDDVLSVDIVENCIEFLGEKNKNDKRLRWAVADINDPAQMAAAAGGQRFDLIVDKATLDAMVCDVDCSGYLHAVASLLRCGGAYALVSLYHCELLQPLLDPTETPLLTKAMGRKFRFQCQHFEQAHHLQASYSSSSGPKVQRAFVTLLDTHGRQATCTDLACTCDFAPDINLIKEHFGKTFDWYLTKESPMLSESREVELRAAFLATGQDSLPIEQTYRVIFTVDEREVYLYQDFCSDANKDPLDLNSTFTVDQAIEFIRHNQ